MIGFIAGIVVLVAISAYLLYQYFRYHRSSFNTNSTYPHSYNQASNPFISDIADEKREKPSEKIKSTFDDIIHSIIDDFHPEYSCNEEDCENQLRDFLSKKFPHIVLRKGHTSRGIKIDFVIEGSIAIELIMADNEGRLLSLLNQMVQSIEDFGKIAVVIVDTHQLPDSKLKAYALEIEKMGITTILKKE